MDEEAAQRPGPQASALCVSSAILPLFITFCYQSLTDPKYVPIPHVYSKSTRKEKLTSKSINDLLKRCSHFEVNTSDLNRSDV